MKEVAIVIPARLGSTRFPEKPLALIAGKSLLQRTIEGAQQSRFSHNLFVATDDLRIAEIAKKCGVQAVMTDSHLPSGSDRVFAAVQNRSFDVVVNVQGDEPLICGELIDALGDAIIDNPENQMATLAHKMAAGDLSNSAAVKVIRDQHSNAIYFSRFPIPYSREDFHGTDPVCLKHIGMYSYRVSFLEKFCQTKPCAIEQAESLEQLRALYLGAKIKVISTEKQLIGVDHPEDIQKVEEFLKMKGLE